MISSICAAVSAIAAVVSCIIHFRHSKPKIGVRLKKNFGTLSYADAVFEGVGFKTLVDLRLSFYNNSSVGGTIADIYIEYENMQYHAETVGSIYDIAPFNLTFGQRSGIPQDSKSLRLQVPLVVPAYSAIMGYFIFPNFPAIRETETYVTVVFTLIDNKIRYKKFRNVRLDNVTGNTVVYKAHYKNIEDNN